MNTATIPYGTQLQQKLQDGSTGIYTITAPIDKLDQDAYLNDINMRGQRIYNPADIIDDTTTPPTILFKKGWWEVVEDTDAVAPRVNKWQTVSEGGSDAIDLTPAGTTCETGKIRFAVDSDGNYGYIKAGADSVTPFKSGEEMVIDHPIFENLFNDIKFLNLIKAPSMDTKNVTNMSYMFYDRIRLTSVPEYDTRNVRNMSNMFGNCIFLTSVPKFNTQNVTNMSYMFHNCSDLTSVPEFDTRNVTNMEGMFGGILDSDLTEDSRNNILAMCTNSNCDDKTLGYHVFGAMDITQSLWTSLPNYPDFVAAGWSF